MMNWKGFEGRGPGLILRYYSSIRFQGLSKTTKTLSWDSRSPGLGLNPGPLEYEGVLTT
jgi:hypothetical protein